MPENEAAPDVFAAIAHPARRLLLDLIAARERSVKDLAYPFSMSRPAISQHLKVLKDAGLLEERQVGREHIYRVLPGPLLQVHQWLQRYVQS